MSKADDWIRELGEWKAKLAAMQVQRPEPPRLMITLPTGNFYVMLLEDCSVHITLPNPREATLRFADAEKLCRWLIEWLGPAPEPGPATLLELIPKIYCMLQPACMSNEGHEPPCRDACGDPIAPVIPPDDVAAF